MVGAVFSERKADEAAAVAGHEVDGFGSDVVCGKGEIALVLAVLVVNHNDHAAGLDVGYGAGDVGERRGAMRSGVREGWGMCCLIFADPGRERQKGDGRADVGAIRDCAQPRELADASISSLEDSVETKADLPGRF